MGNRHLEGEAVGRRPLRVLALQTMQTLVVEVQRKLGNRDADEVLPREVRQRLGDLAAETAATRGSERAAVWAHVTLGDVYLQVDLRPTQARAEYEKSYAIAKKLAAADPKNVVAQADLCISFYKLGSVEKQAFEFTKARDWFDKGAAILRQLDKDGEIQGTRLAVWVLDLDEESAFCRAAEKALESLEAALSQPKELVPRLLAVRAAALARRGKPADAAATADKLADLAPTNGPSLYNAVCGHALAASASEDGAKAKEQYAARAVALLGKAHEVGYFKDRKNIERLKSDGDLDALRQRDDFKQLLADLERGASPKPPEPVGPPTPPDRR